MECQSFYKDYIRNEDSQLAYAYNSTFRLPEVTRSEKHIQKSRQFEALPIEWYSVYKVYM